MKVKEFAENSTTYGRRTYEQPTAKNNRFWHSIVAVALIVFIMLLSSQTKADSQGTAAGLNISHLTLDFGEVAIGSLSERKVVLSNVSENASSQKNSGVITVNSLFLDEMDELSYATDISPPFEIYPGDSRTVTVKFSPPKTGKLPGSLHISHDGKVGTAVVHLSGTGIDPDVANEQSRIPALASRMAPAFGKGFLNGVGSITPTTLQFGPDGRLYVAEITGTIRIMTIQRNAANQYVVINTEIVDLIKNIQNHDDNGVVNNSLNSRLVTGMLVAGTASNPVIYVGSGDPRIGGGASGAITGLDTNSTIISRLTKNGAAWVKQDLVRGLPRSSENHNSNGMALSLDGTRLFVAMGGNTNKGAPSNNFAMLPEYALSAAILEINIAQIGNSTYDLPTLDDEQRPGSVDANDPFGGNRGKNQAKIVPGGPVQVYAPGFRNPYDIIIMQNGKMFTWDNGPNAGWGGLPVNHGPQGNCSNAVSEAGLTIYDSLHFIPGRGYYGGHPNPTRGNRANTFNNTIPQSPVPFANPVECDYRGSHGPSSAKHPLDTSLLAIPPSTNGIDEYTASNFGGAMRGNLLAAALDNNIYRVQFDGSGTAASAHNIIFSNVDQKPLDITTQSDGEVFPGTIWVADFSGQSIVVFEPADYQGTVINTCQTGNPGADADQDGYTNADENANGTDPCSAADLPSDSDLDYLSDLIDPDDDNDGINDLQDPFPIDEFNGLSTSLGVSLDWENDSAPAGYIANLGFSGLMNNGSTDYLQQFDLDNMTISGAAGVVTIDNVPSGDAFGDFNTQEYAFQFGVNVTSASPVFRARTRVLAPFAGITPMLHQSIGLFIGNGNQDNYIKLVVTAEQPAGGILLAREQNGLMDSIQTLPAPVFAAEWVDLILQVDPSTATVTAFFETGDGPLLPAGQAIQFPAGWLTANTGLAVGIISTSYAAQPFTATWDSIEVLPMLSDGPNQAPVITLSPTDIALTGVVKTISASVNDDGLPGTAVNSLWSQVSGPAAVTINSPASATSSFVFPQAGNYTLMLSADDGEFISSETITVDVTTATAGTVVKRINAGGPLLTDGTGAWAADGGGSTLSNTGFIHSTANPVDTSALPFPVPAQLFQTHRWDLPQAPALGYQIPVTPGNYEVRLYFAETWDGAMGNNLRVFGVNVEGQVLSNIDVFAEVGADTALMKSFVVNSDNTLNIDFSHQIENPSIKGIEIIPIP